jgi:hypothetical protein
LEAAALSVPSLELSSTLIVVAAGLDFVAAAHVGDGAVVVSEESTRFITLSAPMNGEFANETAFVGCGQTLQVRINILQDFRPGEIAVCTDGVQSLGLRMPDCIPHGPFFRLLFDQLRDLGAFETNKLLAEFLGSPRVNARTEDDMTLVLARRQ